MEINYREQAINVVGYALDWKVSRLSCGVAIDAYERFSVRFLEEEA